MSSPGPAPEGTTVEPETEINRRLLQRATISAGTFAQIPSVSTEIKFHTRNEGDRVDKQVDSEIDVVMA